MRAHGWEPTVLAIKPTHIEGGVSDPLLETTYPPDVAIVRVGGMKPAATRWAGFGSLWFRCGRAIAREGERLLHGKRFDLVFFSTTQFNAFTLGPRWRARFGVPYVVDYQDPWVNDYYRRTHTRPPGGWMKFAFSQWSARRREPRVLREAAALISVSDSYLKMLAQNYPWFNAARMHVLPFGASDHDFAALAHYRPGSPLIDFEDGKINHVYTGRCGPDMADSLTAVFRAFARFRAKEPTEAARMRFHFIGTGYAPPPLGEDTVLPLAQAEGVADAVHEHRYRVPYFDALYYLRKADALVAVGSNDPGYSASKIFPFILARRPMLLVFHEDSSVLRFAAQASAGLRFGLRSSSGIDAVAAAVCERWFAGREYERAASFDEKAGAAFTAETLTAQLAAIFNGAILSAPPPR